MAKIKLQWPFIIAVLVLLVIVSYAGIWYSEQTSFCVSCHEMKVYGDTWRVSSHGPEKVHTAKEPNGVGCHACHSLPGLGGFVQTKIIGMAELWKHLTGDWKTPIQGEPFEVRCKQCHDTSKINETKTHKIPHKKHEEMGKKCMDCHAGLVHGHNGEGEVKPTHEACQQCHDTNDQNTCTTCHKW